MHNKLNNTSSSNSYEICTLHAENEMILDHKNNNKLAIIIRALEAIWSIIIYYHAITHVYQLTN